MEWSIGCSFGLDPGDAVINHLPLRVPATPAGGLLLKKGGEF